MGRHVKVLSGAGQPVSLVPISPIGNHQSVLVNVLTPIAPTPDGQSRYLLCQATVQDIRYTIGEYSSPTATTGFHLTADDPAVLIPIAENTVLRFISETAGAILEYQWCE